MREATAEDKELVLDILTRSFGDNQSVNYLIPPDAKRLGRIRALMDYSFETCQLFGKVYVSEDKQGCALVSFPERKKTSLKSLLLEIKLIWNGIGVSNISKAINREKAIARHYPEAPIYYLWFIAVRPESQNKGIGKNMMDALLAESQRMGRNIYLETSTLKNVPWYQKLGLGAYQQLDFGYTLFLMRNGV